MKNQSTLLLLCSVISYFSITSFAFSSSKFTPESIDSFSLSNGKTIFVTSCAGCHGTLGEGSYGPNLCDNYWIHGNHYHQIVHTIKHGVPHKGMTAFKQSLTHAQVRDVAHYVLSLKGSKPTSPKSPEGTYHKP